jgi:hypothetical protein
MTDDHGRHAGVNTGPVSAIRGRLRLAQTSLMTGKAATAALQPIAEHSWTSVYDANCLEHLEVSGLASK